MSRQELAEQVNAYLFHHTGRAFGLDANYVGKLERGVIRWPHKDYRDAFRAILGAGSDRELGFVNPRRFAPLAVVDTERRDALRSALVGAGSLATPSVLDLLTPDEPPPPPRQASHDDVDYIKAAAHAFYLWDHTYGGGFVREAVMAQLQWSARLLEVGAAATVLPDLYAAVGQLAHVTAFMAFDAYAFADAVRIFKFALACAEASDDPHLRAKVLSSMARLAIWRGNSDLGLSYTDVALTQSDRITATEQAMLLSARARALGRLNRAQETLRVVGAADEAFARSKPEEDPPWMAYYDAGQHAGDTGHALFELDMRGYPTEATRRFTTSVGALTAPYVRSQVISLTKLATLVLAGDDPREGAVLGNRALDAYRSVRSKRLRNDMYLLRRVATSRAVEIPEVAELQIRISETI